MSNFANQYLIEKLIRMGVFNSISQAKRAINFGYISLNGRIVTNTNQKFYYKDTISLLIGENNVLIRNNGIDLYSREEGWIYGED